MRCCRGKAFEAVTVRLNTRLSLGMQTTSSFQVVKGTGGRGQGSDLKPEVGWCGVVWWSVELAGGFGIYGHLMASVSLPLKHLRTVQLRFNRFPGLGNRDIRQLCSSHIHFSASENG